MIRERAAIARLRWEALRPCSCTGFFTPPGGPVCLRGVKREASIGTSRAVGVSSGVHPWHSGLVAARRAEQEEERQAVRDYFEVVVMIEGRLCPPRTSSRAQLRPDSRTPRLRTARARSGDCEQFEQPEAPPSPFRTVDVCVEAFRGGSRALSTNSWEWTCLGPSCGTRRQRIKHEFGPRNALSTPADSRDRKPRRRLRRPLVGLELPAAAGMPDRTARERSISGTQCANLCGANRSPVQELDRKPDCTGKTGGGEGNVRCL